MVVIPPSCGKEGVGHHSIEVVGWWLSSLPMRRRIGMRAVVIIPFKWEGEWWPSPPSPPLRMREMIIILCNGRRVVTIIRN